MQMSLKDTFTMCPFLQTLPKSESATDGIVFLSDPIL